MWTLNGVRIFVQKITGGVGSIIAKLQPLAAGTVYQSFGYETNKVKIQAYVVGTDDILALKNMTMSGSIAYTLNSWEGEVGEFYVEKVTEDRERVVSQTLRPDLDCDAPLYMVEIELLEEFL